MPEPEGDWDADLRGNIEAFLKLMDGPVPCVGCGTPIWFVRTRSEARAPFTADLVIHFANCPRAKDFRKKKLEEIKDAIDATEKVKS